MTLHLKKACWLCLLLSGNWVHAQAVDVQLDTIRLRFRQSAIVEPTRVAVPEPVAQLMASMEQNGSWKTFDYSEKPKVHLPAIAHLSRLVKMTIAYTDSIGSLFRQPSLGMAIHTGLRYWLQVKPQSQNWWYNVIGTPQELAKVLLLLNNELTTDERKEGLAWLMTANKEGILKTVNSEATGQNMIWIAMLQMQAACLSRSGNYMRFAIENAMKEMKVSTAEGIQPDYSFHQHGPQLYAGGYGAAFAIDCSRIAFLLRRTAFALPENIIDNLTHYLLDGLQWMTWKDKTDYSTLGREIARPDKSATSTAVACRNMAALQTAQQLAFDVLANGIEMGNLSNNSLTGNRYFPNSDFIVHRRPNYYASVKMCSVRTVASESGNGEAEQNFHMGNGNLFLFCDGKEYENIFPLWDWQKIPGITNRIRSANEALPLITFGSGAFGHTRFVGGVSDSLYGAAAFDADRDSTTGKKAWFFFDEEIVCLGAGLNVQMNAPLTTSINQCFTRGEAHYSVNDREKTLDTKAVQGLLKWVYHDGVAYYFEGNSQVNMQQEKRQASWSVINRTMANPPEQSGTVFSLWLNHPAVENSYTYTVVPSVSLPDCRQYHPERHCRILANTVAQQAVQQLDSGIVQAIFWQAGRINAQGFGIVTVDKPCMLMLRKINNLFTLSVSDPTGDNDKIQVQLSVGGKIKRLWFHLPLKERKGYTTKMVFTNSSKK